MDRRASARARAGVRAVLAKATTNHGYQQGEHKIGIVANDQETFPLGESVTTFLASIRQLVVHGQGFVLIQGLPVTEWPIEKSAAIYLAIGTLFGRTLSQNRKGHVLGHVKDLGNDPTQIDKVRIYS